MSDPIGIDTPEDAALERRLVRRRRKQFAAEMTPFALAMQDAMSEYRRMRSQGVSREDGIRGLEAVLRASWPKAASKFGFTCGNCEDTGWVEHHCAPGRFCGRELCLRRHPPVEHTYVRPCGCPKGDEHRRKMPTAEDAVSAAGRVQKGKKRGWTPVGA